MDGEFYVFFSQDLFDNHFGFDDIDAVVEHLGDDFLDDFLDLFAFFLLDLQDFVFLRIALLLYYQLADKCGGNLVKLGDIFLEDVVVKVHLDYGLSCGYR